MESYRRRARPAQRKVSSHLFKDPGTYNVTLTVTDAVGKTGNDTMTVTVRDITGPQTNAGPDISVDQGTTVTFDGTGTADRSPLAGYAWTFTDGAPITLYGPRPEYTFEKPGCTSSPSTPPTSRATGTQTP